MNPRDIGVEWQHETLPLKLWIHPHKSCGRVVYVDSVLSKLDSTLNFDLNFYLLIANAFILDYEWAGGDENKPLLIDYLEIRNLHNISSTLDDFLMLSRDDYDIAFNAYLSVHPTQNEAQDAQAKKKKSVNTGLAQEKQSKKDSAKLELEPTG